MLRVLWSVYRSSPAWAKTLIRRGAVVPRLLLRPFVSRVRMAGFDMYVDLGDNAAIRYLRWGDNYEKRLRTLFLALIRSSPQCVVLDVGASYGTFALSAAALGREVPIARILAIEPDERCVASLRRSVSANGFDNQLRVIHALAGEYAGEAELHLSTTASTSNRSFVSRENDDVFFTRKEVRVLPAVRLDDEILRPPVAEPLRIVAKIDVEGSEARVLLGMQQALAAASSCALLFEYYPTGMRAVGQSPASLMQSLSGQRWTQCWVNGESGLREFTTEESLWQHLRRYYDQFVGKQGAMDVILLRNLVMPPGPAI